MTMQKEEVNFGIWRIICRIPGHFLTIVTRMPVVSMEKTVKLWHRRGFLRGFFEVERTILNAVIKAFPPPLQRHQSRSFSRAPKSPPTPRFYTVFSTATTGTLVTIIRKCLGILPTILQMLQLIFIIFIIITFSLLSSAFSSWECMLIAIGLTGNIAYQ